MTITLPNNLEHQIRAAVEDGRFPSLDAAMAEAARLLLRELDREPDVETIGKSGPSSPDPLLVS